MTIPITIVTGVVDREKSRRDFGYPVEVDLPAD
jgi:hypothetical protein